MALEGNSLAAEEGLSWEIGGTKVSGEDWAE